MESCPQLLNLQRDAWAKQRNVRTLLKASDRIRETTGFSDERILDIILESLDKDRRSREALASHVGNHRCSQMKLRPA